jgi:hypothetical protein
MIGPGGIAGITQGAGFRAVNKFGLNNDIDAGPEDIWAHGGLFPFLDAGIAMDISSSVAADTLAGTGAQRVRLTYYTTDNTEVTMDIDLNGVTAVPVGDDVKICTRAEVIQTGSGNANAGELNLVDRATGLIVYQSIEIGEGQTLSAVQICPKGKRGAVVQHQVSYSKTQNPFADADMRLYLRKADGSILVKHSAVISAVKLEDKYEYPNGSGIDMTEGEIVFWRCLSVGATDTPIEARFDVEFVDA